MLALAPCDLYGPELTPLPSFHLPACSRNDPDLTESCLHLFLRTDSVAQHSSAFSSFSASAASNETTHCASQIDACRHTATMASRALGDRVSRQITATGLIAVLQHAWEEAFAVECVTAWGRSSWISLSSTEKTVDFSW
ncbi:hypothetical protein MUK42_27771 [Musa troglodytarum]|uniref:Uncharacterized protein n=1 Tax=Musa troglodytarum TaxID=320322 RepID=A0A9E7EYR3_9LILI|nr:hypothetical protein MUK42_27771 [Musa troglodytarum]